MMKRDYFVTVTSQTTLIII